MLYFKYNNQNISLHNQFFIFIQIIKKVRPVSVSSVSGPSGVSDVSPFQVPALHSSQSPSALTEIKGLLSVLWQQPALSTRREQRRGGPCAERRRLTPGFSPVVWAEALPSPLWCHVGFRKKDSPWYKISPQVKKKWWIWLAGSQRSFLSSLSSHKDLVYNVS